MTNFNEYADFAIIGSGIIGLSIARELKSRHPTSKIIVLEKEAGIGLHASGRNSGVLHTGIYYPPGSLKAKFCLKGARLMAEYCKENSLPFKQTGKIILPTKTEDVEVLHQLHKRAIMNGAKVKMITKEQIREIEPAASNKHDVALFSPETAVVEPLSIIQHLKSELEAKNVKFYFNHEGKEVNIEERVINTGAFKVGYGHLFNCAGLYADSVAKFCGLGGEFKMIPFKGMYFDVVRDCPININHLIYPVPDMSVPFLGIHFTKGINNKIFIGPTAVPAFGRENYHKLDGFNLMESINNLPHLCKLYLTNKQGFRSYAHREIAHLVPDLFLKYARSLVPKIKKEHFVKSSKVGIRAQLFNVQKGELVTDFTLRFGRNETHIVNAASPAFTSAFSFSKYVIDKVLSENN